MLVAAVMLLSVRNGASWSDRPFVMGHVQDKRHLNHFYLLWQNEQYETNYMLLIMRFILFSGCYLRDSLHLCHHKL